MSKHTPEPFCAVDVRKLQQINAELLEALNDCVSHIQGEDKDLDLPSIRIRDRALAAIQKATGGQK